MIMGQKVFLCPEHLENKTHDFQKIYGMQLRKSNTYFACMTIHEKLQEANLYIYLLLHTNNLRTTK